MAGYADRAFREICIGYGAAFTESELASAKALVMQDRKSKELITVTEKERPMGIQLFGSDPSVMSQAVVKACNFTPDFIDLNMGCPAPKVASNGCGSALLRDLDNTEKIVRALVGASDVPVTAKIRTGWDSESINAVDTAKMLEQCGVSAITVHGRTREQMYSGKADLKAIADVVKAVSIPVIGNGDITDVQSAAIMLRDTGCYALMVGRGALGRPWIFQQINAYISETRVLPEPPVSERMRVMVHHVQKLCEYKGDYIGMREARAQAACYIKGIKNAAQYRNRIGTLCSMDELVRLAYDICRDNG